MDVCKKYCGLNFVVVVEGFFNDLGVFLGELVGVKVLFLVKFLFVVL